MSDHTIQIPNAKTTVDHDGVTDTQFLGVRVYGESPETACIQIRTLGSVTASLGKSRGKTRPAFSSASLTRADAEMLIDLLRIEVTRLRKNYE